MFNLWVLGHISKKSVKLLNMMNWRRDHNYDQDVEEKDNANLLFVMDDCAWLDDEWIIDIGCSYYMSPYWYWFSQYESVSSVKIFLGNNIPTKTITD